MTLQIDSFTGGIFDTNCFFLQDSGILIDAPQEAADWLRAAGYRVQLLLLTHGHIDHTWDAARIQREHDCRLACHPETVPMVTQRDFFRQLGLGWDVDPAKVTDEIAEGPDQELGGVRFDVLLVPGHCPGSLCFLDRASGTLFGGDVLFAGGVGRWDLPGGDRDLLFDGILKKIYPLDDAVRVLPGHGPATTVGQERRYNPFVGLAAGDEPLL
jgi:glyoxylase-like metal-dependent hydrolase (beta-lactamase superfamily II)